MLQEITVVVRCNSLLSALTLFALSICLSVSLFLSLLFFCDICMYVFQAMFNMGVPVSMLDNDTASAAVTAAAGSKQSPLRRALDLSVSDFCFSSGG